MGVRYPAGANAQMPVDDCGKRLDGYLKARKVSRTKLSKLTGIDIKTISAICTGKRYGNMATWRAIARALHCTLDDILEG